MQRKIGWRQGLGAASIPPKGGTAGTVVSAATDPTPSRDTDAGRYNFVIERESRDDKTMHARFSFEIEFDQVNQYYTVFFEGCCRPAALANNAGLVFHVRTELFVNSDSSVDFPLSSFRFTPPTQVVLKREGPGACEQIYCRPNACNIDYQLQGYHEQPEWHATISFRKGTADEMGRYKCKEKVDTTDPASVLGWKSENCPSAHTVNSFTEPVYKLMDSNAKLRNDGAGDAGVLSFDVSQNEGTYQTTVVAEMLLPNGVRLIQVLDSKVQVAVMTFNDQPTAYVPGFEGGTLIAGSTEVDIVSESFNSDAPSYPVKATPIEIQCGRSLFFLNKHGALDLEGPNLGESIDFAFLDPDFKRASGSCPQFSLQTIDFIDVANSLPRGLVVSETTPGINGVSKVELSWTPVCEDRSQVGLFQVCFYAKDKSDAPGFIASNSVPSPAPSFWTIAGANDARQYHPTCLYLKSLPPAVNPRPVLATDRGIPRVRCGDLMPCDRGTTPPTFNGDSRCVDVTFPVCTAAGMPGPDESDGIMVGNEYVLGGDGSTYHAVVGAESDNNFFKTDIRFFYPDATNTGFFSVSEPKYGCTATAELTDLENFDGCVSNSAVRDKVARKLTVTLVDPMTQNTLRICYQGFQTSPDNVDEAKWKALYGTDPAALSYITCFILNIINAPVWPAETRVDNTIPINVAVGSTYVLPLTTRNLGSGDTSIFILADPGAPDGSRIMAMSQTGNLFVRNFEYTPTLSQAGMTSRVCFTASTVQKGAADPVDSDVLCYDFYVYVEQISWITNPCPYDVSGSVCRAQGVKVATVGCKTELTTQVRGGDTKYYDIKLRMQKYPHCSNCYEKSTTKETDTPIGVAECSSSLTHDCCGNGICDGAETGWGCPQDCQKDDGSLVADAEHADKATLVFTPLRHQQGRDVLVCIEAYTDIGGTVVINQSRKATAPSLCILFEIESCRYCVPAGATLKSIARHYLLNVDWLRLYNTNPEVSNPDMLLPQGAIQVGPLYSVAPGDTLLSVAATMKTTVKMLMENNPQIPEDGMIKVGKKVCVVLCSNA